MSFVIVKYGNEQEKLFNPNVQVIVFLNHVKKACGFEQCSEPIDLATDTGEVIDLQSFLKQPANAKEAARKYLDHRATYILVKCITETTEDEPTNFVPLLTTVDPKIKFSVVRRRRALTARDDDTKSTTKTWTQGYRKANNA